MSTTFTRSASHEDQSVNFWSPHNDGGALEARLVRRTNEYIIAYLSSHTGCSYSCRFCHLTATKQTMMTPCGFTDYLKQAQRVLQEYQETLDKGAVQAQYMHFNFMARGEPLANPTVISESTQLFKGLGEIASQYQLPAKFLISSILPRDFNADLSSVFSDPRSVLYYSLYSLDPAFRKRWLPKALPGEVGLDLIQDYQQKTGREICLHWAFIKGQNDEEKQVDAILEAVHQRDIKARFNLVRYNPHSARHGEEPDDIHLQSLFERIKSSLGNPISRIVPRVGYDVKASCGMFLEPADLKAP